jgi:hypothetical protein
MNFLTRKALSRRQLLRGAGVSIGLPFLDAMQPAFASGSPKSQPRRVAVVYVPNGIIMKDWTPDGPGLEFKRILAPLAPFRQDITLVSGLSNLASEKAKGGAHAKASGSFLSGAIPKYTAGADVHAGTTFDQVAAKHFAGQTRVASLQLGCEDSRMIGNCDTGSSCAYTNSLSWKNPDTPMAVEVNPRSVFERLFGSIDPSLDAATRARRALYRNSILDLTRDTTQSVSRQLGALDKRKLDEYLSSIREVELGIRKAEQDPVAIPPGEKPSGIPLLFSDYVRLMFDLQVIAFQADLTRVSTMMMGREGSVRVYPEIGVPDPHHPLTHHRGHPDFIEKVAKINCHHAQLFSHFIARLKATSDGDGSLLDHSAILYGGALSEGNGHSIHDLPLLVAGHAGGIQGGRRVRAEARTPATNLFLRLLSALDVPTESFGDSTGMLAL